MQYIYHFTRCRISMARMQRQPSSSLSGGMTRFSPLIHNDTLNKQTWEVVKTIPSKMWSIGVQRKRIHPPPRLRNGAFLEGPSCCCFSLGQRGTVLGIARSRRIPPQAHRETPLRVILYVHNVLFRAFNGLS